MPAGRLGRVLAAPGLFHCERGVHAGAQTFRVSARPESPGDGWAFDSGCWEDINVQSLLARGAVVTSTPGLSCTCRHPPSLPPPCQSLLNVGKRKQSRPALWDFTPVSGPWSLLSPNLFLLGLVPGLTPPSSSRGSHLATQTAGPSPRGSRVTIPPPTRKHKAKSSS